MMKIKNCDSISNKCDYNYNNLAEFVAFPYREEGSSSYKIFN